MKPLSLSLVLVLGAAPLSAQFGGFCQSGQQCDFFSEVGYAYRLNNDPLSSGFDHSILFESGILSYPSREVGVGASGFWGVDFAGHMRTGLKFRMRRLFGRAKLDAGIGAIFIDSRGFSPSFVADLGFSPVKPVTVVGTLEVIRRGNGRDEAWWYVGARVGRDSTEPDAFGTIILGAGVVATIIRSIVW